MGVVYDDVEFIDVRPGEGLDWGRVEHYLRASLPELSGSFQVHQFPHGSANLTYLIHLGATRLVLRRPPFGQIATGAHDMRREYTALAGLSTIFDRVPKPYLFCDDHTVAGADFLVVEFRAGVVVWDHLPPPLRHHPDVGVKLGLALIETLADLHSLDPASAGLEKLGRPKGYLARQLAGWRRRWERVDAARIPVMGWIGDELARTMPPDRGSGCVIHNDFKLNNCQFDPASPSRVKTVFDWDMATLGDPLADLGTLLNFWPDEAHWGGPLPHTPGLESLGLPSRAQILHRYAERTGSDLGRIEWYEAFAHWKHAIILEQLYQRWVRGESTDPRMAERGKPVAALAERAVRLLRTNSR